MPPHAKKITAATVDATSFVPRHIGPSAAEIRAMLDLLGYDSLDSLIDATVPSRIRLNRPLAIHAPMSEHDALSSLAETARRNQVARASIGLGDSSWSTP